MYVKVKAMMEQIFEWAEEKAQKNLRKHHVSFEEAALVFDDPLAISRYDKIVNGECSWKTIGLVSGCLLLVVAHTLRDEESGAEVILIISAKRAEPKERRDYEHNQI